MPRSLTPIVVAAYILMFFAIFPLRSSFFRQDQHILFWVLIFEHLAMIPLTIGACVTTSKNRRLLASLSLGSILAGVALFVLSIATFSGISDPGMGIIIFLLFPLVDAFFIGCGILGGIIYWLGKLVQR